MSDNDSVRTQVLKALVQVFKTMDKNLPADDPYGWEFSVVSRDTLGALVKGKRAALGVYGGTATRKSRYPFYDVSLEVVLEAHVAKQAGVDMTTTVETLLGVMERRLKENNEHDKLGGLILDIEINGDQVNVDGQHDNEADGALFVTVRYSQREDDPRKGRC